MNLLRRTFGMLNIQFLIQSWLIAGGLFIVVALVPGFPSTTLFVLTVLNTLLFPFTRLVWRSLIDTLFYGNTWILGGPLLLITLFLNLLTTLFLWTFTIFIAPLGIGYLLLRTRSPHPPTPQENYQQ